ncbi:MAG: hypothetical protein ACP5S8_04490 [Hydrogenobaculum sp.]
MLKYIGVLALLANVSFGFTLGDELQNVGNTVSNLGNALNGGGAYSNIYSNPNQCNVPPGWQRGRKTGFVNGMPPGLAKKGMMANCQPTNAPMENERFEHGPMHGPPRRMR